MEKAIANKSGKEFTVVSMNEETVVLRDENGDIKEIKAGTFKKGYTLVEEEEKVTVENTQERQEEKDQQCTQEQGVNCHSCGDCDDEKDTVTMDQVGTESKVELVFDTVIGLVMAVDALEDAVASKVGTLALDTELPTDIEGQIKFRDNARQAYKENEVRFRNAVEEQKEKRAKLVEDPTNTFLTEEIGSLDALIEKYSFKLLTYYKRYSVARDVVAAYRKALALENADI